MDQDLQKNISQTVAKILLDTESVKFNAIEPFTYTSGKKGPVYIDVRRLMSFPQERSTLMDAAAELLRAEAGDLDYLAGGETAGIPYAAFIAERMNLPMVYVRKKAKGHGRMAQIEGYIEDGTNPKVAVIEDLQNRGGSKQIFIDALREAGAIVEHAFVIFNYGIYGKKDEDVTLHSLANWWDVLDMAKEGNYFDAQNLSGVEAFLNDPENWDANAA